MRHKKYLADYAAQFVMNLDFTDKEFVEDSWLVDYSALRFDRILDALRKTEEKPAGYWRITNDLSISTPHAWKNVEYNVDHSCQYPDGNYYLKDEHAFFTRENEIAYIDDERDYTRKEIIDECGGNVRLATECFMDLKGENLRKWLENMC